nr:PREDICTED: uncharacterized protein LOC107397487 isoform X1 [Tribolium castaneum]XP_015833235.1 PREDICTED: uncharacterized protein LOC107397487 isoform X1 [Tribolium castaneum]|eukprot:XP_015833234.1 PREDICTED: uncharacterized protein LOC107397487 isoform X1 [Tribolium castaneum]
MRVSSEKMKIVYIIEAAGAGYKVLEVTLGNVDTYFHTIATKKWDICAENSIYNKGSGRLLCSRTRFSILELLNHYLLGFDFILGHRMVWFWIVLVDWDLYSF